MNRFFVFALRDASGNDSPSAHVTYAPPVQDEKQTESWRARLRAVTRVLLSGERTYDNLGRAATELYDLLATVTEGVLRQAHSRARILPAGTVISPPDAATCTRDPIRTAMFLRGAAAALRELRRDLPDDILEVVYAGTGPFAPLVLPLLASGALANAHVTFIDISDVSLDAVRGLVERIGSSGHTFVAADAATYQHDRPIHLVISETMQRALTVEPQFAVTANLVPQLHPLGRIVPACVCVDLCVETRERPQGHSVGAVFELSAAAIRRRSVDSAHTLVMPRVAGNVFYETSIQTYGEHHIRPGESGITMPEYLWDLAGISQGEVVTFWYECDEQPRIRYSRSDHSSTSSHSMAFFGLR